MVIKLTLLLWLAIALSIDAFSIALAIGILNSDNKTHLKYSLLVSVLHFLMPLVGSLSSKVILQNIILNTNKIMGIIIIILDIQMIFDFINNKNSSLSKSTFIIAFSVSVDSFFAGIGLETIKDMKKVSYVTFSIVSFIFSFLGCKLGKFGNTKFDSLSKIIAIIILLILGVKYILL